MPLTPTDYVIAGAVVVSLALAMVACLRALREGAALARYAATSAYDVTDLKAAALLERRGQPHRNTLVVLTHGWRQGNAEWHRLLAVAGHDEAFACCDVRLFTYPRRLRQRAGIGELGAALSDVIELHHGEYDRIILIGYSIGGLITRSAFLHGLAMIGTPWAGKVSRIVLFGAPNRGFAGPGTPLLQRVSGVVIRALCRGPFKDMLHGSDFMTRLRLDWVDAYRDPDTPTPSVIQVLGVNDPYVQQGDSRDLTCFDDAKLCLIQNAKHDLPRFTGLDDDAYRRLRASCFDEIGSVKGDEKAESPEIPTSVVFQIHGIRDFGGWLAKFAADVKEAQPGARVIRPRYGYFSALGFILPWVRNERIAWFCDRYTDELALLAAHDRRSRQETGNPLEIPFHLVGHSYGTYLFAHALQRYRRMRFVNACLVGSVVPPSYAWQERIPEQLRKLRNDCQSHDWPVAILCQVLHELLRFKDVGPGGFVGFEGGTPEVIDKKWVAGDHSICLRDDGHRQTIVRFLLEGEEGSMPLIPAPPRWLELASKWAAPMAASAILLLAGAVYLLSAFVPVWPLTMCVVGVLVVVLVVLNYA